MSYFNTYYRVTIANGNIDPTTNEQYMAMANASVPATLAASEVTVSNNLRYRSVIQQLQLMGNMYVANTVVVGGNANITPSSLSFTLIVEQGDSVLSTIDETNTVVTLTGNTAIIRCIARGLNEAISNTVCMAYDPTSTTAPSDGGSTANAVRVGERITTVSVTALSNSLTTTGNSITVLSTSTI